MRSSASPIFPSIATLRLSRVRASGSDGELCRSSFHRQSDVVFGQRLRRCARTGHTIQFGELAALIEGVFIRKAVQHGSHPPGEALYFPDAPQANFRIIVEQVAASRGIKVLESPGENAHIGDREIQSFGASRWHDVGGISR